LVGQSYWKGYLEVIRSEPFLLIGLTVIAIVVACTSQATIPESATLTPTAIATPSPTLTRTPIPTVWNPTIEVRKSPECLEVISTDYLARANRAPSVVGEIQNNCSFWYSTVTATVVLVNGLLGLQVDNETRDIGPLGPGERGSFGARWRLRGLSDPLPRARDGAWDAVVIGIQGTGQSLTTPCIQGILVEIDENGTAIVTNSSKTTVSAITVARTGYNAEGNVVASDITVLLGTTLDPGQLAYDSLNPSSNPRFGSTTLTFNYYTETAEPVSWTARACRLRVE